MEMTDPKALIHQAKELLQNLHPNLSQAALEQEWSFLCSNADPAATSNTNSNVPRSMSMSGWQATSDINSTSHAMQMNRSNDLSVQSAPDIMSRGSGNAASPDRRRNSSYNHLSPSSMISWQTKTEPTFDSCQSSVGRKRSRNPPLPQVVEGVLHDPSEFLAANTYDDITPPAFSPPFSPLDNMTCQDPGRLSVSDCNSQYTWGSSALSSQASTPLTDLSVTSMSRNGSFQSDYSFAQQCLPAQFDMMRMQSEMPSVPMSASQSDMPFDSASQAHINLQSVARSRSSGHAIPSLQRFQHSPFTLSSSDTVTSPLSSQSASFPGAPSLQRSDSDQSTSSSSSSQSQSRSTRRHHEQLKQQKNCPILPKASDSVKTETHKMTRIKSVDGSYKQVGVLQRKQSTYQRPQHPKVYCRTCNKHPEGFRGEHELQRHISRAHSTMRKVWICVDPEGPESKFLANCKACRNQKRYGAYYNAAAHLRRAHFNPRKRGRKAKTEAEKRGGKGGGNFPPMDFLKDKWMREIEELVNDQTPPLAFDPALDAEEDDQFNEDTGNFDFDTSFIGRGAFDIHNINFAHDLMSQAAGLSSHYSQLGFDNQYQFDDSLNSSSAC